MSDKEQAVQMRALATDIVLAAGKYQLGTTEYLKVLCLLIGTRIRAIYKSGLISEADTINMAGECELLIKDVIEGKYELERPSNLDS